MNLPTETTAQITRITDILTAFCPSVRSILLHGSICLGGYVHHQSDIDLIVVTDAPMNRQQRIALADALLPLHEQPCPIELSVVAKKDAKTLPVLCQFHFSSHWAARYASHDETNPLLNEPFPDDDLPSYFRLIRQRGIVLFGEAPDRILADVTDEQFFSAVSDGCEEWAFDDYGLFDSNILTFARVLSFACTHRILTKVQGAKWAMQCFPQFENLLSRAVAAYESASHGEYSKDELEAYRAFMVAEIQKGLR